MARVRGRSWRWPGPGPGPGAMTKVVPLSSQQIQQLLEDNAVILKAISESQSLGRWEECEKYQRLVHKNLTCLAALADAQQRARMAAKGGNPNQPPHGRPNPQDPRMQQQQQQQGPQPGWPL
mmetsp:Transcript_4793/g.12080  ORF Transcript_4793/g.12080 Transcript_4793/m.12080 type:complete len:122 (-) Transcript_4793:1767-2132(-)